MVDLCDCCQEMQDVIDYTEDKKLEDVDFMGHLSQT